LNQTTGRRLLTQGRGSPGRGSSRTAPPGRHCYWPGHDQAEYGRISKAGGTFCGTCGPDEATAGYGEFLGYLRPRKVRCGREALRAAGTVTRKRAEGLAERGYSEDTEGGQERAGEAARDLPDASEVLDLLDAYVGETAPARHGGEMEGHFWVERSEPGKLWLRPLTAGGTVIGPVPVPREVTGLCQPRWDIGGVVAKTPGGWRLVEVWNVSP
jgi:hypothetical protein